MFKTLLASTFLLFNVSNSVPKKEVSTLPTLYGAYCLRDNFDVNYFDDTFAYNLNYNVFLQEEYNNYLLTPVCYIDDDVSTVGYYYVRSFSIVYNCDDVDTFDMKFSVQVSNTFDDTYILGDDAFESDWFSKYDVLNDYDTFDCTFIIFFPQPYNVSTDTFKAFSNLFTSEGNDFCTYVNGYYSLINTDSTYRFAYFGQSIVNNNMANYFTYRFNTAVAYNSFDTVIKYKYLTNGAFEGNNSINIQGTLIPNSTINTMRIVGTFSYVYQPQESSFGEMLFSVIDAPIYMLSQLFNFELLGVQFYVGFMSIVTIVLICFLIKKVI